MAEIITGDTVTLVLTLREVDGSASNISAATLVRVALIAVDRSSILAGPYTVLSSAIGAAWGTGVVVVTLPGTDTSNIAEASADIEVEAVIAGVPRTWPRVSRGPVKITIGLIN